MFKKRMMPCGRYQKDRKEIFDYKADRLFVAMTRFTTAVWKNRMFNKMTIKSKKDVNGTEIADKVTVQLMATDPYLSPRKQLVKSSEKKGLFLAMDIADIWLERALANKM